MDIITAQIQKDSSQINFSGAKEDISRISSKIKLGYTDSSNHTDQWINLSGANNHLVMNKKIVEGNKMPQLKGMGLKDVVFMCENMGLKVMAKGRGRVAVQSILSGEQIVKGQRIEVALN